jgi:alpha-N-arabinofuranosidase
MKLVASALLLTLGFAAATAVGENPKLTVAVDQPTAKVNPMLYGLMTEEINHCYDGGLYAELVQNRAFKDDAATPVNWSAVQGGRAVASIALDKVSPVNEALDVSLRLDASAVPAGARAGIANAGYWGIPVKPKTRYNASFYARAVPGFNGSVTVSIESEDGSTVYASEKVSGVGASWRQFKATLKTGKVTPTAKARLVLTVDQPATVWFSLVSLFPPTYKNRSNGNRQDLMKMLAEAKPAFLRFPGGNYLEGDTPALRFEWKKTIGPVAQRPGHQGPWGYRSTDGLGFLEFLYWCEDLKMEPVLAVYAGYSLKGEHINPGPALEPYVQEALEEIEYVTGGPETKWGAQRAKDGHPAPFKLTYVEIGNEDWFDKSGSYDGRFAQFYDAIKAKYPQLQCISTVGNEQPAKLRVVSRKPEVLDEHYYRSAATFEKDAGTYFEKYDRNGPKIFVGEWAAYEQTVPWEKGAEKEPPTPSMKAALGDAAWMAAMERNADIIVMQCYAPLFVNVNPGARQWRPDLIGYDAIKSFGSPSYYAIQMFGANCGDTVLKAGLEGVPASLVSALHYSVTRDSKSGVVYIKFVNSQKDAQTVSLTLTGVKSVGSKGSAITLAASSPADTNAIDQPTNVVPKVTKVAGVQPSFDYTFPPHSITVLQLKAR